MEVKRQEDLDMLTILGSIRIAARRLRNGLARLVKASLSNFFTIGAFMLVTTTIALLIYSASRPYYRSHLLLNHIRVDNSYCKEMVENVNGFIDLQKGNRLLARELGIPDSVARELKAVKFLPLNENLAKRYSDSTSVLLPFTVEADVFDPVVLDTFQAALVHYLEMNEYGQARKKMDADQISSYINSINAEMRELDSLKDVVTAGIVPRASGTGIILGEPIDPVSIHKRRMDLFEKLIFFERRQEFNNSFEVAVGFSKSANRASPGPLVFILAGMLLGYLAALIFITSRKLGNSASAS